MENSNQKSLFETENIKIDQSDFFDAIVVKYNGMDVDLFFWDEINQSEKEINLCVSVIDKYEEIIQITKKLINKKFNEEGFYFRYMIEFFRRLSNKDKIQLFNSIYSNNMKIEFKNYLERINNPSLEFFKVCNDEFRFGVMYWFKINKDHFCVLEITMDLDLNYTDFYFFDHYDLRKNYQKKEKEDMNIIVI